MTDETTNNQQTTTPPPPPADNGANNSGQSEQDPQSAAVKERIRRAKQETERKILESLGFEDLDTAKTVFAEVKQIKEGQLTEAQKAQKAFEKAQADANDFKAKYEAERTQRTQDRVNGAIRAATGLADPKEQEQVLILIRAQHADDVNALIDDKGEVSSADAKALVDKFRQANPKLFSTTSPGSPSNRGAKTSPPGNGQKDAERRASLRNQRTIRG